MKKSLLFILTSMIVVTAIATSNTEFIELKKINASEILIPIGKSEKKISLFELSRISRSDSEILTGKKMNLFERIAFKKTQKRLSDGISDDGTITDRKIKKFFKKSSSSGEEGFHLGGFALGFLLGLIGVIIAYIINDDYKKNRVKWSWIGLGVSVALALIILAAG